MKGIHEDLSRQRARNVDKMLQQIVDPQAYECSVMGYMRSHRRLVVGARKALSQTEATHDLYLCCEALVFFEGPMSWHGLDFRLASCEERRALVAGGWVSLDEGDLDAFADDQILLILERPGYRVRICAGNCGFTEILPTEFMPILTTPV